jgi:hypothetical protein
MTDHVDLLTRQSGNLILADHRVIQRSDSAAWGTSSTEIRQPCGRNAPFEDQSFILIDVCSCLLITIVLSDFSKCCQ